MPRGGKARWTNMINFRGTDNMESWLKKKANDQRVTCSSILRLMVVRAMSEEGFNIEREVKRLSLEVGDR